MTRWSLHERNVFRIVHVRTARNLDTFQERFVDLDTFLRNCAVAGALCAAFRVGHAQGVDETAIGEGYDRYMLPHDWHPGCGREVPI